MKIAREGGPVRYRARVEYDGTDFSGFQVQVGARTVQGELQRALSTLSAGDPARVEGAGRTDAGVHARGQVIAFDYGGRLGREDVQAALNGLLPVDVAVRDVAQVEPGYRPRYRATQREYRYVIWNGPRSPLRERFALGVGQPLDIEAMREAARLFVGEHDFSAFGGKDRQPRRTLYRVEVARRGRVITITVVGTAFLRGMVRRIVAALIRVGHGETSLEAIRGALGSTAPAFEGEAAPARGLTLWRVPMGPERDDNDDQGNE